MIDTHNYDYNHFRKNLFVQQKHPKSTNVWSNSTPWLAWAVNFWWTYYGSKISEPSLRCPSSYRHRHRSRFPIKRYVNKHRLSTQFACSSTSDRVDVCRGRRTLRALMSVIPSSYNSRVFPYWFCLVVSHLVVYRTAGYKRSIARYDKVVSRQQDLLKMTPSSELWGREDTPLKAEFQFNMSEAYALKKEVFRVSAAASFLATIVMN